MKDFLFYVEYGMNHVLDINGYDHLLFLAVLAAPFMFKNWKPVLILVSTFTIGHTLSLILASYNIISVGALLVEFLIPITILVTALYNILTAGKQAESKPLSLVFLTTLFFGLIHGLGFAREFRMLVDGEEGKFITLLEFALGIEIAQIIIVFIVLFIGFIVQTVFRYSKRDWVLILSAIVIGLVLPMILSNHI